MFNRKLKFDSFTSLVGPGMVVTGDLTETDTLKVEGKVVGNVVTGNELILNGGTIDAAQKVEFINASLLSGTISTEIMHVTGTLRIMKDAVLSADEIHYGTLEIEPGARLHNCRLMHLSIKEDTRFPGV